MQGMDGVAHVVCRPAKHRTQFPGKRVRREGWMTLTQAAKALSITAKTLRLAAERAEIGTTVLAPCMSSIFCALKKRLSKNRPTVIHNVLYGSRWKRATHWIFSAFMIAGNKVNAPV
jgi:hypothetical protein